MDLRALPSIDSLLHLQTAQHLTACYGHNLTVQVLRTVLEDIRSNQPSGSVLTPDDIVMRASRQLERLASPSVVAVINASGVILHTNLGRAPLSQAAVIAAVEAAGAYSNLEYDLDKGKRGSRQVHCERLVTMLTGAEAAIVVNNNAAAVLLVLTALARRQKVVISRTQLVEIGGGFRVPEVMAQSGARLVEVGTTNRVHIQDYQAAFSQGAAGILRAHPSNFRIIGFTSEPSLAELAVVAHEHAGFLVDDLGSGALLDTSRYGLAHEPTVQESIAAGADVVCFSGDKLIGGPQAGIIAGRKALLDKIRKHPLARAVRADKTCLASLGATLIHYLKGEAERHIPIWQMISLSNSDIEARAKSWQARLGTGSIIPARSTVGGGSLPGETLPTYALALQVTRPERFLASLRKCSPPVIARIQDDLVLLDPRTVLPGQVENLIGNLAAVLALPASKEIQVK